jgi:hypothetical protein
MGFRQPQARGLRRWVVSLVVGGLVACATTAQAGYRGPFEGRVVDAETRQPIQGAVVFVEWLRGKPTAAGRVDSFYDAAEALTDETGFFRIKKKWSWNPWTNWMLEAHLAIFKAGYGSVQDPAPDWSRSRLEEVAQYMKARTEEERKRVGPEFYFNIEFEGKLPVFLLKKLTTVEERMQNRPHTIFAPEEKMKLLRAEDNRERKAAGLKD